MGIYQGTCAVEACIEITFFIAPSILPISHRLDHLFNPFQTGVAFNIQTGHLNWRENHMTDFYMKCITGLICIDKNNFFLGGHPLSTYAKFSEKLTLLTHVRVYARTCAYQWPRNVSFSENFAYVLKGWPLGRFSEIFREDSPQNLASTYASTI